MSTTAMLQHGEEILELYGLGIPVWKLAQTFALDHGEVCEILEKQGIKPSANITTADYPEIAELHAEKGYSAHQIADWFGTNHTRICEILRRMNVEVRKQGVKIPLERIPEVIELYQSRTSAYEIGKKFNVTPATVRRLLRSHGVKLQAKYDSSNHFRKISQSEYAALAASYIQGATARQIAVAYEISEFTVYKALKHEGVELRGVGQSRKIHTCDYPEIAALYEAGLGSHKIGQKFGVSATAIRKALRKQGVKLRDKGRPKAQ